MDDQMPDDEMPDEFILNGVNASENSKNRGKYLLKLTAAEIAQIALGHKYSKEHLQELAERQRQHDEGQFGLEGMESDRDVNKLADAGWGVIFPARKDTHSIAAIRDALGELLAWREEQAGDLYKECIGEKGYLPKDTADRFMQRYGASPGTVDPTLLPYYLLIVGDVSEIPYRFQYELDATYLVGRIYFKTLEAYARYAHSVVAAEKGDLRLPRRAVFFGTAHENDRATQLSSEMLVEPLAQKLEEKRRNWQVDLLSPAECSKARLESLLGRGDAPALLFTASHGVGFDKGDLLQLPFQGALLCQDLEAIDETIARRHYLGAEDIADDFQLHGLVNFHFACFGAGTPQRDSFTRPDRKRPAIIAENDFLAALPGRLLSHPNGGALAVIGHVDRAWTYSFKWGGAGQQTTTFQETLLRLMSGKRIGWALDEFNIRYAQIAVRLTGILDIAENIPPTIAELAGLWTANNDARGYALLGDPAVFLPVVQGDEAPLERQALAPIPLRVPEIGSPVVVAAPPAPLAEPAAAAEFAGSSGATADQELRLQLQQNLKALATQLDTFADDLIVPAVESDFELEAEALGLFGRETFDDLGEKLRQTLATINERLTEFAADMVTLEVRTYTSEQIEAEDYKDGKFTGDARQRALTRVSLDGDTQIVIPYNAGELDEVVWEIHARAVEQAQANRAAILKAVGELLAGLIPAGK